MFHSILYPSIISYNTAIAACEHGPWDLALALLEDLQRQGLHARADTLSTAMSVCSKALRSGVALQLLSKIPRHTPQRHLLIAYNTALNACARSQRWTWSLELLEDMSRVDLSPDVVSFSSAVTACGKSQAWPMVLGLLEDLNTRSCAMNDYLCNAVMDSCSRSFQWQVALGLLQKMDEQKLQPSMVGTSLAVSTMAASGHETVALSLLQQRPMMRPDEAAYVGMMALWTLALHLLDTGRSNVSGETSQQLCSLAMAASEASGQWESALAILAKMQDHGPQPNLVALNAAASALLNCGRLAEALALYREGPRSSGLLLVTGAGRHGGRPVLAPRLRPSSLAAAQKGDGNRGQALAWCTGADVVHRMLFIKVTVKRLPIADSQHH
eukprot:g31584.t2